MECGFDTHKNALINNLVILFDFFCAVESIYSFFQTDRFFWFNILLSRPKAATPMDYVLRPSAAYFMAPSRAKTIGQTDHRIHRAITRSECFFCFCLLYKFTRSIYKILYQAWIGPSSTCVEGAWTPMLVSGRRCVWRCLTSSVLLYKLLLRPKARKDNGDKNLHELQTSDIRIQKPAWK